jgi:hypothetical protein
MLKDFFTKNLYLKFTAIALAIILWAIARFWVVK